MSRIMRCSGLVKGGLLLLLALLIARPVSAGEDPRVIHYSGTLNTSANQPEDGIFSMTFRIYGALTGGSALYSETQSVQVDNGRFKVNIGAVTGLSENLFASASAYLTIEAPPYAESSPREKLVGSAYSLASSGLASSNDIAISAGVASATFTVLGNLQLPYGVTAATAAFSGAVSAGSFSGDGSALTGITPADGSITTAKLAADAVITSKILDASVSAPKLADGAVTTNKLAPGAITAVALADGLVTTGKLGADAVTTAAILNGAVTTPKIAPDAITASALADGLVTTNKLATDAVITSKILDGAVTTNKLGADAVTAAAILNQAITSAKIANAAVSTNQIAADAVITAKIFDGAVTTPKLAAASVTTSKLAADAVSTAAILNQSVTSAKVAISAITTSLIAADAVTTAAVLDASVTTPKLATDAVITSKILTAAVTTPKLAADAVSTVTILNGAVTTSKIGITQKTAITRSVLETIANITTVIPGGSGTYALGVWELPYVITVNSLTIQGKGAGDKALICVFSLDLKTTLLSAKSDANLTGTLTSAVSSVAGGGMSSAVTLYPGSYYVAVSNAGAGSGTFSTWKTPGLDGFNNAGSIAAGNTVIEGTVANPTPGTCAVPTAAITAGPGNTLATRLDN